MKKLKRVKVPSKILNKSGFTDLQAAGLQPHWRMIEIKQQMYQNPGDYSLQEQKLHVVQDYKRKHKTQLMSNFKLKN